MKGQDGEDYCVLVHSNRICLVTLAPSHPILSEKKTVTKVNFQINPRTNRLENHLSGKRKRGGQLLADNTALCIVTCSDGSSYQPCGCIKSVLIEANAKLAKNPALLTTKPETAGFIAIVLTKLQDHKKEISRLLTPEQYHEAIIKRTEKTQEKCAQDVEKPMECVDLHGTEKNDCENVDNKLPTGTDPGGESKTRRKETDSSSNKMISVDDDLSVDTLNNDV